MFISVILSEGGRAASERSRRTSTPESSLRDTGFSAPPTICLV